MGICLSCNEDSLSIITFAIAERMKPGRLNKQIQSDLLLPSISPLPHETLAMAIEDRPSTPTEDRKPVIERSM